VRPQELEDRRLAARTVVASPPVAHRRHQRIDRGGDLGLDRAVPDVIAARIAILELPDALRIGEKGTDVLARKSPAASRSNTGSTSLPGGGSAGGVVRVLDFARASVAAKPAAWSGTGLWSTACCASLIA